MENSFNFTFFQPTKKMISIEKVVLVITGISNLNHANTLLADRSGSADVEINLSGFSTSREGNIFLYNPSKYY